MRLPLELYNFRMSLGPASAAAWNRSANSGREHVESLQLVHSHVTLNHLVSQVTAPHRPFNTQSCLSQLHGT